MPLLRTSALRSFAGMAATNRRSKVPHTTRRFAESRNQASASDAAPDELFRVQIRRVAWQKQLQPAAQAPHEAADDLGGVSRMAVDDQEYGVPTAAQEMPQKRETRKVLALTAWRLPWSAPPACGPQAPRSGPRPSPNGSRPRPRRRLSHRAGVPALGSPDTPSAASVPPPADVRIDTGLRHEEASLRVEGLPRAGDSGGTVADALERRPQAPARSNPGLLATVAHPLGPIIGGAEDSTVLYLSSVVPA
jgi:hypothetical protein